MASAVTISLLPSSAATMLGWMKEVRKEKSLRIKAQKWRIKDEGLRVKAQGLKMKDQASRIKHLTKWVDGRHRSILLFFPTRSCLCLFCLLLISNCLNWILFGKNGIWSFLFIDQMISLMTHSWMGLQITSIYLPPLVFIVVICRDGKDNIPYCPNIQYEFLYCSHGETSGLWPLCVSPKRAESASEV